MVGQPNQSIKPQFIPFPIGGVNLLDSPINVQPNEATDLENYIVTQQGLKQLGSYSTYQSFATGVSRVFGYQSPVGNWHVITCGDSKIYNDTVDVTGGVAVTSNAWQASQFGGFVFLTNGVDQTIRLNVATAAVTAAAWTGVTDSTFIQSCNYKSRFYAVVKNSLSIWFATAANSSTGPMTQLDLTSVVHDSAAISFITSWSYNQGLSNDELFVIVLTSGEVIVFSGDYPLASNWTIAARTNIPLPAGNRAFVKLGQDVYVATNRGLLSLSQVFQGRSQDAIYYSISRKLGFLNSNFDNCEPAVSTNQPLIYFSAVSGQLIFCLNYELGAWSILSYAQATPTISNATGLGAANNNIYYASNTAKKVYLIDQDQSSSIAMSSVWSTPYLDYGTADLQKQTKLQRLFFNIQNSSGGTLNQTYTLAVSADWSGTYNTSTDFKAISAANLSGANFIQELAAPGTGKAISYKMTASGDITQGTVYGVWTYVDNGGAF